MGYGKEHRQRTTAHTGDRPAGNAVELEAVRKEYKGFTLKDVSFSLPTGYIMGLVGPNGAGKTTIIKLIMNLIRRDGGEISVFGRDNLRHEAAVKRKIAFVSDEPTFPEDVTLRDIKTAYRRFYETWDEEQFQRLAEGYELPMRKTFKKLSHGMKTKFNLALALSHDADLILMDEPTSGLDPIFRRKLLDSLAGLLENGGKSVLFSTHITSDLERIADYITFIRGGEIVFSTDRDSLAEQWAIIKGGEEILGNGLRRWLRGIRRSRYGVEALTWNVGEARRVLPRGATVEKAGLDDIVYFVTKGDHHA